MMNDTDDLIALVHAQGVKAGIDPERSRLECPFCDDRIELCHAWLAGYSIGRMSRPAPANPVPVDPADMDHA